MGLMTMGLITSGRQTTEDLQLLLRISTVAVMGLDTSIGGYKIIPTIRVSTMDM